MSQRLCDSLLLHAEGCGTTGRSRVDRDGGISHMCVLERLAAEHPHGNGDLQGAPPWELHVSFLGHTGKNIF